MIHSIAPYNSHGAEDVRSTGASFGALSFLGALIAHGAWTWSCHQLIDFSFWVWLIVFVWLEISGPMEPSQLDEDWGKLGKL